MTVVKLCFWTVCPICMFVCLLSRSKDSTTLPWKTCTNCGTWYYIIWSCRGVHTVVLAFDSSRGGYVFTYGSGAQVKIWRHAQERASESNKGSWSQNKPQPWTWRWKLNERQGQLWDGTRHIQSLSVQIKLGQRYSPSYPEQRHFRVHIYDWRDRIS